VVEVCGQAPVPGGTRRPATFGNLWRKKPPVLYTAVNVYKEVCASVFKFVSC